MGASAQQEAPRGPGVPSLVLRRVVGCNSATSSGPPAREHRRIVRILPLDAGTCICGNVLPVDPRANARTTFYIPVQDPLLQPLSATHAPQPGPQQCSRHRRPAPSAATSTRHACEQPLQPQGKRMTWPPTVTSSQGSLARRRRSSRHYLSHGETSTELSCLGPCTILGNFTQCHERAVTQIEPPTSLQRLVPRAAGPRTRTARAATYS